MNHNYAGDKLGPNWLMAICPESPIQIKLLSASKNLFPVREGLYSTENWLLVGREATKTWVLLEER